MLPARSRVHRPGEFRAVVRRGARAGRQSVVVHASRTAGAAVQPELSTAAVDNSAVSANTSDCHDAAPRVGFIVSKAVGNAVTRNRVKRRLRHMSRELLATTPKGTLLVVRALPAASSHPDALAADLASAWAQSLRRLDRPRSRRSAQSAGSPRPARPHTER